MMVDVVQFPRRRRHRLKFDDTPAEVTDLTRTRHLVQCLRGIRIARELHAEGLLYGPELIEWIMLLRADADAAEQAFRENVS